MNDSRLRTLLLLVVVCLVAACGVKGTRPVDELTGSGAANEPYRVRNGDTLSVRVWGEPNLSGDVVVREDGKFTMSLVNDVEASGKYLADIQRDVTDRLLKFVPGASVVVSLKQTAPVRFYLGGSFQKPGEYRSESSIRLLQAIAMGGGFAPFADYNNILLIRQASNGEERYALSYDRIPAGKDPNPELRDGDTVQVK